VSDVLRHRAGLCVIEPYTIAQVADMDFFARHIEKQPSKYPNGTKRCYHALTQGFILNEITRFLPALPLKRCAFLEFCRWTDAWIPPTEQLESFLTKRSPCRTVPFNSSILV
jgi:hypothetical protein